MPVKGEEPEDQRHQVSGWAPEMKEPEPRSLVLKFARTPGLSWHLTEHPGHTR